VSEKSLPTLASELWDLVRAYAKQETVEPLKGLGRYVGYGLGGGVLLSIGLFLLALGGLRVLQEETGTTFQGNWSWAPYLIVVAVAALIIGLLVSRMGKRKAN
jgi:tetrahydromethanopterin S-methyltransferase subunit C